MSIGVLALVGVSPERMASLAAAGYSVREGKKYPSRMDACRDAGDTVKVVLTNGRGGINGDEMALLPRIEIICAVGAGYEAIDLETAKRRGIAVANCPDMSAPAVADSAMMLLLATTRHLLQADRFVRAGGWQEQWPIDLPQITGKRLGILGLGKIGGRIAYRASRGFDMDIGYHNRKPVSDSPYRYFDRLIALANWADFLVIAAPGGPGTRHLVNADVLTALGPKGYIVNVGRGTIVDTAALLDALRSKRIAGAGLDVVEGEPNIPPELLRIETVIVTPHTGGRAPESRAAATAMIIETLNAHFTGEPLPSPIFARS